MRGNRIHHHWITLDENRRRLTFLLPSWNETLEVKEVTQKCTHVFFAESDGFHQTVTSAQRSREPPREETQQHNSSNAPPHPLDGFPFWASALRFFWSSDESLRCLLRVLDQLWTHLTSTFTFMKPCEQSKQSSGGGYGTLSSLRSSPIRDPITWDSRGCYAQQVC